MVRPEVIRKRLNKLDEYLTILYDLKKYEINQFLSNPEIYGSTERFLHLAIEAVIDMGNHVIADLNLGIVNQYSDIPTILEEKGYLSKDLKNTLKRMIGFRNTLIHDYVEIDRQIVYNVLQSHLKDFESLKKIFTQFL